MVKRAVFKDGTCNVKRLNTPKVQPRSWSEVYVALIELSLSTLLLAFSVGFVICWLFFALLWYLVAYFRGDLDLLDPDYLSRLGESNGTTWRPCVEAITGFASCFLFSLETLTTIGGGDWYPNEDCLEGIILLGVQVLAGMIVEGFLVGLVFAKLIEPHRRNLTVLFSEKAVIMLDEKKNKLALAFRVGNVRKSNVLAVQVQAYVIWHRNEDSKAEGMQVESLSVTVDSAGEDGMLFLWPVTVTHHIDDRSPFYTMKPSEVTKRSFEIVAVLEGEVENIGRIVEARTSYLPHEVKWGYHFAPLFKFRDREQKIFVDFTEFDKVEPSESASLLSSSAKDLDSQSAQTLQSTETTDIKHCDCCTLRQRRRLNSLQTSL